jgi:hypothetical protein
MKFFANLRELFGWVLVGTGLATFGLAGFLVLNMRMACSATIVGLLGYVVFRGGMTLIRLAVAGRAAADSRQAVSIVPARPVRRPVVLQPSLATPTAAVIPGPKPQGAQS